MESDFFERFLGKCTFCKIDNIWIVFYDSWRGQSVNNTWIKKGHIALCSPCSRRYGLETKFDRDVKEMCEVLG